MREFTEAEKQLLITAGWLNSRYGRMAGLGPDARPTDGNLRAFGDRWIGRYLADWSDAYRTLVRAGLMSEQGGEYTLTGEGEAARKALEVDNPLWLYEYDNFFADASESRAHALFCEEVYGMDLCQHGLADLAQLGRLIAALDLAEGDRVLDLGCGSGHITEYLCDATGAFFQGVDLSGEAIRQARARTAAKSRRLSFDTGNMNRLDFGPQTFDAVAAVDTLYYVDDLEETLRQVISALKPGGRMGIFYTQWINGPEDEARLLPQNTALAAVLKKCGLSFTTSDLTAREAEHWRRKVEVLERLRPEFEREGNLRLYDYRYSEAVRYARWDSSKRSRYLYHVRLQSPPAGPAGKM